MPDWFIFFSLLIFSVVVFLYGLWIVEEKEKARIERKKDFINFLKDISP